MLPEVRRRFGRVPLVFHHDVSMYVCAPASSPGAGVLCRRTKLIYPDHLFPPWLIEDAARDRSNVWLGGNVLVREMGRAGPLGGVLNSDSADIALSVDVEDGVFVEVASLRNGNIAKFD